MGLALGGFWAMASSLAIRLAQPNDVPNVPDHPLAFSALNGDDTSLNDVIDICRPRSAIQTLEIFTDGYVTVPVGRTIADWEASAAGVEATDFSMVDEHAAVKGATSLEHSDDRAVIVLDWTSSTSDQEATA